jgi:hypothetical protein
MRCELAHGRVGVQYPRQNVAPCGIGERSKQLVQNVRRWLLTYNHMVVDNSTPLLHGSSDVWSRSSAWDPRDRAMD